MEGAVEDGHHAIWSCPESKKYWKKTVFWEKLKKINERDPCLFINELRGSISQRDFDLFAIMSWNIWNCRNRSVRGEREPEPNVFTR